MTAAIQPEREAGIAERAIETLRRINPEKTGINFVQLGAVIVVSAVIAVATFIVILSRPIASASAAQFAVVLLIAAFATSVITSLFLVAGALTGFAEYRLAQLRASTNELEITQRYVELQDTSREAAGVFSRALAAPIAMRGQVLEEYRVQLTAFAARVTEDSK